MPLGVDLDEVRPELDEVFRLDIISYDRKPIRAAVRRWIPEMITACGSSRW